MPAHIVCGLSYGDEGKGLVTDHLVRSTGASQVVRFNGGAQAAHNVINGDRHHTFSQFSAGTLAGASTILSKYMLVNPHALFVEWEKLREIGIWPAGKISVQQGALVTTPFHIAANRLREHLRGTDRHGTCGMGIGETVQMANKGCDLRVEDLRSPSTTRYKLNRLRDLYAVEFHHDIVRHGLNSHHLVAPLFEHQTIDEAMEIYRIFVKTVPQFERLELDPEEHIIFEGAQGVLLDEYYGFHPHTTWSKTTSENALKLLFPDESVGDMETRTIGVMRSYMTRHGAGPFVTEDPDLHKRFPEAHNSSKGHQGVWRVGWTDFVALSYSLACTYVDELAITHLDRVQGEWKICTRYSSTNWLNKPRAGLVRAEWEENRAQVLAGLKLTKPVYEHFEGDTKPEDFIDLIEAEFDIPVTIRSFGPTHRDVKVQCPR